MQVESRLNMSDEEFEDAVKQVSQLIFDLTLKGRKTITITDVATYDALGQCVATLVTKTADAIQEELEQSITNQIKRQVNES